MKKIILAIALLLIVGGGTLFAIKGKDNYDPTKYSATLTDGLKKGSTMAYTLPDQFDHNITLDNSIDRVVLVFAKATGHTVKEFLKNQPADYLTSRRASFIADISPMPVVIRNTFALPDLKKQHYSVGLIYDSSISENFKKGIDTDSIVVVTLKDRVIQDIKYIKTEDELKDTLK
ncbi:hypothetical protein MNB_SV-6-1594 [hydrothermal vent metagenome]|uniref:FAD/FMN-containing dehydrogenases n=1 Tax=hydrothermal vent metagenome TaxID=652676 RepID=A0A1W1C257_9ZZZZ